jgi:hypothetical protein
MKKPSRIIKNGSAAAAATQVQIRAISRPSKSRHPGSAHPGVVASKAAGSRSGTIGVVFYDWDMDHNIADFDLDGVEFSRIREAVAKRADFPGERRTLTGFIREALLESATRELFPGNPMTDLEDAVAQANGLIHLALENQSYVLEEEGGDFGRARSHELVALSASITDRLQSAFKSAWDYAHGRAA